MDDHDPCDVAIMQEGVAGQMHHIELHVMAVSAQIFGGAGADRRIEQTQPLLAYPCLSAE